ncbi:hypothetical protein HWV62_16588 [Athelia sp. TMB]|nr:hypothetical protein HWV62_16588 [Athelia sp. TMB]
MTSANKDLAFTASRVYDQALLTVNLNRSNLLTAKLQMLLSTVIYGYYVFGLVEAISNTFSQSYFQAASRNNTLSWHKCGEISGRVFECARLSVPMDYADPSVGDASLSILRLLADANKRRGSIFTNPGGPGISGTGDHQRERSLNMMEESGGQYDIVSWDIRGVNDTTPKVACFDSQESADTFWAVCLAFKIETNSSLRTAFDHDQFFSHVGPEDARLLALWKKCESKSGKYLPYVGTAANARDVARLADVIDGFGSEINYWLFLMGCSMLQDGAPSLRCALASVNSSTDSILADIDALLQDLYDPFGDLDKNLTRSSSVLVEMFMYLQLPRGRWPAFAQFLKSQKDLVSAAGDLEMAAALRAASEAYTALYDESYLERHEARRFWGYDPNYWSIACSDGPDYNGTTTRDLFDSILEGRKRSKYFGTIAKPKHPVLILSNEYDPVTSIENAYRMLENTFAKGDAGLGIREGYGV